MYQYTYFLRQGWADIPLTGVTQESREVNDLKVGIESIDKLLLFDVLFSNARNGAACRYLLMDFCTARRDGLERRHMHANNAKREQALPLSALGRGEHSMRRTISNYALEFELAIHTTLGKERVESSKLVLLILEFCI